MDKDTIEVYSPLGDIESYAQSQANYLSIDYHTRKGRAEVYQKEIQQIKEQFVLAEQLEIDLGDEIKLLHLSAQAAQASIKNLIESLVTRGLQAIFFDRTYRFVVTLDEERRASVAEFTLEELVGVEWHGRDFKSVGGGVADVVSALLRIAAVVLRRPQQRRIIWLDEPFKHVWEGYQARISTFLSKVTLELDLQIILTTHCMEVTKHADEVWKAVKENGACTLYLTPKPECECEHI